MGAWPSCGDNTPAGMEDDRTGVGDIMSCEWCAESAARGSKVCEFCLGSLDALPPTETSAAAASSASAEAVQPLAGLTPLRLLEFVAGFLLAFGLMGVGLYMGSGGGDIGAVIGALATPLLMVLLARSAGARGVAAGGIAAVAVVVIVFGGCLMLLSRAFR